MTRAERRAKTKATVARRLKMVKCIYDAGNSFAEKPGKLRKGNTSCGCWMCKEGRKSRRPE